MNSQRARAAMIFALLLVIAFLTRFPFFFPDVINWDESTFILVGQSMVDGHLPYVGLYDLKPPLLFAFFAAVIAVAGKSVAAIRFAGMMCVGTVAYFTYDVGRRVWNARVGGIAGILYVVAAAVVAGGRAQATMSEIVALVPLMASLVVLLRNPGVTWSLFAAGCLLSIAGLVRSNLVVVAVGIAIWVVLSRPQRSAMDRARDVLAYGIGGVSVLLLAALPFALVDKIGTFWNAVFVAPVIYSSSQSGPATTLATQGLNALGLPTAALNADNALGLIIWLTGTIGIVMAVSDCRSTTGEVRSRHWPLFTYTFAVLLSIVVGGAAYSHYLIQLLPFFAVYAASVYSRLSDYPIRRRFSVALAAVLFAFTLLPVAKQYLLIISRARSGLPLAYGRSYDIAKILRPACSHGCSLYLLTDQLVYWLLSANPPIRLAAHPANVVTSYIIRAAEGPAATPQSEMQAILRTRPDYIVKPDRVWYLDPSPAGDLLRAAIRTDYRVFATIDDETIYRHREPAAEL
jgi:hypothetical protein